EADLATLLAAEFDAVMFCNEGDRPYALTAGPEGVAAMTRVVAELAPRDRPSQSPWRRARRSSARSRPGRTSRTWGSGTRTRPSCSVSGGVWTQMGWRC